MSRNTELGLDKAPARYVSVAGKETINEMAEAPGGPWGLFHTCVRTLLRYQERAGRKEGDTAEADETKAAWYAQMARHILLPERYPDPRDGRDEPWEPLPFEFGALTMRHLWMLRILKQLEAVGDGFGAKPSDIPEPFGYANATVRKQLAELRVYGLLETGLGPKETIDDGRTRRLARVRTTWLCDLIAEDIATAEDR